MSKIVRGIEMFGWLKQRLRQWLSEPVEDPNAQITSIECFVDGKIKTMGISGACGMRLSVFDEHSIYLIGPERTTDTTRFWRAWKRYQTVPLKWEDGSIFEPPI